MSGILFDQYQERLRRLRASDSALKNHARTATLFREAGLDSESVTDIEIEEWLLGLPHNERTRELHFQNTAAVFRYAQRRGVRRDNPTEYVKLPRRVDKEPRVLTHDELRAMKERCHADWQVLMFHLFAYAGLRRNEVRCLTWEDVLPDSLRILGKGGKLRYVPTHPALGEVLADVKRSGYALIHGPHGDALADGGFYARFRQIAPPGATCHDFRRTVANELYDADVPDRVVDEIMGWAPRTVGHKHYRRRASGRAREAILTLYRSDPL